MSRWATRRTGLTLVGVASAAVALGLVGAPAEAATAATPRDGGTPAAGLDQVLGLLPDTSAVTGIPAGQLARPLTHLKIDPLAQTGVDPLNNSAGTAIGGLPVGTDLLTGSLAHGASAATLLPLSGRPYR